MTTIKELKASMNWFGMFIIILIACVFALIRIALAPFISMLNRGNVLYGEWASGFVAILLFYLYVKDIKLIKEVKK
jgi:uncharacterized protein YqhQ